jgi:pyruvate dehydrogenase E2 component (dihydrolipoamide acetyltransferase)
MQDAPHFYVMGEFDCERAVTLLRDQPVGINDLIQYLVVQTLQKVRMLNATYHEDRLIQQDAINLAIAVALESGLITPVLHGADQYSLTGLAARSRDLIRRTRDGKLKAEELQGGTFTISNLGIIPQVERFTAVINPPQVAILAVGAVKQRPVVRDGGLFIHHTVHLSLSGDHRVVDGMHLAQFMAEFENALEAFTI